MEYNFREIQQGEIPHGAEPFNAIRCFPEGRESIEFYVMAIESNSNSIRLFDSSGNSLPNNQVNITYPLASRLRLKAGDTISFINQIDGTSYNLVINGIADTYAGQFIFMPIDRFNFMTGMPRGSYSGLMSNRELNFEQGILAGVKDMRELGGGMDDLAAPMMSMIVMMTLMSCLIGVIIIFLVTSLMIEESRKTISLLKIFGYRKKEISKLILSSSTWVVIAGFILGIPLMLVSGNTLYSYLGESINVMFPMILNPLYVVLSFIVIFAMYYLTRMICGRKLAKIEMSEALKAGSE